MKIISHRGIWKKIKDQNKIDSLLKSIDLGYGIEFDVRDYNSKIVISHDLPNKSSPKLEDLFKKINYKGVYLLINIKSDGLQAKLNNLIKKYKINNYFVFDMSIPDTLIYIKYKIKFLIRISEFENNIELINKSSGLWIDHFKSSRFNFDYITSFIKYRKKIFIVSPELHKKKFINNWKILKNIENKFPNLQIYLCTDYPNKADKFFND